MQLISVGKQNDAGMAGTEALAALPPAPRPDPCSGDTTDKRTTGGCVPIRNANTPTLTRNKAVMRIRASLLVRFLRLVFQPVKVPIVCAPFLCTELSQGQGARVPSLTSSQLSSVSTSLHGLPSASFEQPAHRGQKTQALDVPRTTMTTEKDHTTTVVMQTLKSGEPPFAAFFSVGTNYTRIRGEKGRRVCKFFSKLLQ